MFCKALYPPGRASISLTPFFLLFWLFFFFLMNFPSLHLCFPWDLPFFNHLSSSSFWDSECSLTPLTPWLLHLFGFTPQSFFGTFVWIHFNRKQLPWNTIQSLLLFKDFWISKCCKLVQIFFVEKQDLLLTFCKKKKVQNYYIIPTSYIDIKFREIETALFCV